MPTYRYTAKTDGCETCLDGFEVLQALSEDALTECPSCKTPIRRVIGGATCVTTQRWNEKKLLSDDNLRKNGFKKLVKTGDGKYVDVLKT